MKKRTSLTAALLLAACTLCAATDTKVMQFKYTGPVAVNKPFMADSLNVEGKPFEVKNLLKYTLSLEGIRSSEQVLQADTAGSISIAASEKGYALHLLSFYLNSDRYVKGTLEVTGSGAFEVFVNDKSVSTSSELILEPRRYEVIVKYLTAESDTCAPTLKACFKSKENAEVVTSLNPEMRYTQFHLMEGTNLSGVTLSPNGKYALVKYVNRYAEGKSESYNQLMDATTGNTLMRYDGILGNANWMPQSNHLYHTRKGIYGRELVLTDPESLCELVLANNIPEGNFRFSPDERTLLYSIEEQGPKEGKELIRVLNPSDRLPGYRNRSFIWRYDLLSGLFEQLTFGHQSTYINDISADSRHLLFSVSESVYTDLPHHLNSLFKMDLNTLAIDTIWEKQPGVSSAAFSPDGKMLMVSGSGDAFDGIGLNIKLGQMSNGYDGQLFLYNLADRKVTPITKNFDPAVTGAVWNSFDNQIYIHAEDKDYRRLFTCNPANGKIRQLATSEDVVFVYSLAKTAPLLYYYGQGPSNACRLYAHDLKGNKSRLIEDLTPYRLKDIVLGEMHDWNFTSADGTTIQGRYYLPPHFDPNKKYPMLVYYYGGTSPTERVLEMRYSMHMYAALGYVVYTLNPSGSTGFGQEFAARHVNAWGIKTADEIIQGTQEFCKQHPFVNEKKIGCMGASYGGFMTQYLQTRTNIFAAAVSHAGISALSSYWGEGYWGWGYCSVANRGTYPWNNPEFFTKQSPLFAADKINTPLLLLHGNADTNVPVGESVQMFAALKLLGKTVEFIQVDGEDHGIIEYHKRVGWQNSIFAWFAKWLKEEPEWWTSLYPERTL